jgi:rhodanese-related sulfurtransferase
LLAVRGAGIVAVAMPIREFVQTVPIALLLAASVAAAQSDPKLPAADALAAAAAGKVRLIDIRTPREWRETGVAPGAARIDFYRGKDAFVMAVLGLVGGDRDAPIALICRTGNRTSRAQKLLRANGFTRVYDVSEGMAGSAAGAGWLARGLPVEPCAKC